MCFKYSLKFDIKRITIKIKMKLAVKVFITYLVRLWTNATEFFLSLTDLLTATYSYMCLVVPPWEWYLWCGVTACWDLFSEYRFCWFLTSVLSCEGYICYFMCPSQVVYTWSWIFKFWWCVYIQFLVTLLSCCSSSVSAPLNVNWHSGGPCCLHLQEEATCSFKMSVYFQQTAQHYVPEDRILCPFLHFYGRV